MCACMLAQSCLILCDPTDCSPQGSSVQGISQARILQWAAISSSRGSSQATDRTLIFCISCKGMPILYLGGEALPRMSQGWTHRKMVECGVSSLVNLPQTSLWDAFHWPSLKAASWPWSMTIAHRGQGTGQSVSIYALTKLNDIWRSPGFLLPVTGFWLDLVCVFPFLALPAGCFFSQAGFPGCRNRRKGIKSSQAAAFGREMPGNSCNI